MFFIHCNVSLAEINIKHIFTLGTSGIPSQKSSLLAWRTWNLKLNLVNLVEFDYKVNCQVHEDLKFKIFLPWILGLGPGLLRGAKGIGGIHEIPEYPGSWTWPPWSNHHGNLKILQFGPKSKKNYKFSNPPDTSISTNLDNSVVQH